jgi:hypothetical protein
MKIILRVFGERLPDGGGFYNTICCRVRAKDEYY